MYDLGSWPTATMLLILLLFGIEAGYRVGLKAKRHYSEVARQHVSGIRASMLGILALLLGFTFSQSLQRFEARSTAAVAEANAIGTAYLRAQLTPRSVRQRNQTLIRDYLHLRVQMAESVLNDPKVEELADRVQQTQTDLWLLTQQTAAIDSGPINSLFVQSVNDMIDSYGTRAAEIRHHVPEPVILTLFVTFVMSIFVVGVSSGIDGERPPMPSYLAILVVVLTVFITIDLDHPRSGLIEVSQESLFELHESITRRAVKNEPVAETRRPVSSIETSQAARNDCLRSQRQLVEAMSPDHIRSWASSFQSIKQQHPYCS